MMKGTGSCLWWFWKKTLFLPFSGISTRTAVWPPTTVGSVGFQQILPCVAVQAALAEVLALLVLALVIEETVEVLAPGVVKIAGLFNQQQIYAGYSIRLGAEPVNNHALILTKYVNGQVIQLLHFWDLRDERGGIYPLKVQTIFGGVPSWSLWVIWWRWICPSKICQSHSKRASKTVVIPVFHVDNCLLRPYSCWEWDVRAASQWLISSDVQPESLHSVDHPPRPSLRPLFKQLQEVGDGLVKILINFAGLEKGLLLVAQHRVCVLLTAVWVILPKLDLESELELDSIESQELFLELVMDSGFHFLQKGSCINA